MKNLVKSILMRKKKAKLGADKTRQLALAAAFAIKGKSNKRS